jgi:hypothetical protein
MNEKVKRWLSLRPLQRHSLVLLVGGMVYIGLGWIFMTTEELSPVREATLALALEHAPLKTWGFIFVVAGILAVISARWPSFSDRWGYAILTGLASGWAGMYCLNYIFNYSHVRTLGYGMVWGLLAFMWWAISGLVNPAEILQEDDEHGVR